MLGHALTGIKVYDAAEELLVSGYEGLKEREDTIPAEKKSCLSDALENLVTFYESREADGDAEKAGEYRA